MDLLNPTILWALAAIVCMTAASAIMGTFTLLRKQALIGDAVSHAILPGICLAFMITQTKHPLVLMLGATASGFLGLLAINYLTDKTKLKNDASLAIVLSVFYGLGILLLTSIQSSGNAAQAGLDKFLFGKAAALMQGDAITFAVFGLVLIGIVVWLFRPFKLITFDRDFAQSQGLPVRKLELLLSILTVSAIALGIQAVGVVLMAALLIAPAAAARYWTHDLRGMLLLSVLFAIVSGILGVYVSATYPNMPLGPWIVSFLSLFAIGSVILGRKKGILANNRRQRYHLQKMRRENILKCMWQLGEADGDMYAKRSVTELQARRFIPEHSLHAGLKQLIRKGWIEKQDQQYTLTSRGQTEGARIVRIHRLWELYLTTYLNLPADHVHEDAEAIEHIITPEIEKELQLKLAFADEDPHASKIPYRE
ncbi:MAG: iron chelate uptake ABC transporter family permease subunit [Bacteroidota bacterium]